MLATSSWARFWAVDIHVHTPGSADSDAVRFGDPADIVNAAVAAGLDCIVITDHNCAAWCDRVAVAAADLDLVVLPGVELSTSDGHLLGVWEEGTCASVIEDLLVSVGLRRDEFGNLEILASKGMAECAQEIEACGGLAIAAHIDKERGILSQPVVGHQNALLRDPAISAFEFVRDDTIEVVRRKLRATASPIPALVQGSDCWNVQDSRHDLRGIGARRTWIKAGRPDLVGIRYALDDPTMRVRLDDPSTSPSHPTIERITFAGGFLDGLSLDLGPDLNCLLGGTGAGKSLILEAVRYVLDQQTDARELEAIRREVDGRLQFALGATAVVTVDVRTAQGVFRFSRVWASAGSQVVSEQRIDDAWVRVGDGPATVLPIAAFSQGEILEYARQPVGRVALVDAHLDLTEVDREIQSATRSLEANARRLLAARQTVDELKGQPATAKRLRNEVDAIAAVFDSEVVKQRGNWTKEQRALDGLKNGLASYARPALSIPDGIESTLRPDHDQLIETTNSALAALRAKSETALQALDEAFMKASAAVAAVRVDWDLEYASFKEELDKKLLESPGATSVSTLSKRLAALQLELDEAEAEAARLTGRARPELEASLAEREDLLTRLRAARDRRRAQRRARVGELNLRMAGFVKLDIPTDGNVSAFRAKLDDLKVGSRVREPVLDAMSQRINPYRLVRELLRGETQALVDEDAGITAADVAKLLANIDERDLWAELLEAQLVDIPDVLNVKFRKPDEKSHTSIEELSHGQKCTAILVILLADGDSPVLVDQPEDALHAPWIEEYLVDRLRQLRGTRQYIFATRSPGLVVSADAEQLVTLKATAGRGECEARGSLERLDLNELALRHLEGGKVPFRRRARKLRSSLQEDEQ